MRIAKTAKIYNTFNIIRKIRTNRVDKEKSQEVILSKKRGYKHGNLSRAQYFIRV